MPTLADRLDRIRVVLSRPTYNGNLGQVARAMTNFGLRRLDIVDGAADPRSDEARWYAREEGLPVLGSARRFEALDAALADCRTVIGTSRRTGRERRPTGGPEEIFRELAPWRSPHPTALVFGPEANGLSSQELDLCQQILVIPADPLFPSLNLAHAVAVVGYALARAASADEGAAQPETDDPPATHAELEAMYAHARRVWLRVGYIQTPDPDTLLRRWRRMFGRARLRSSEVGFIRALLHQTDWCAEVAELPHGGARETPQAFDKHRVRLNAPPDESDAESADDPADECGGPDNRGE